MKSKFMIFFCFLFFVFCTAIADECLICKKRFSPRLGKELCCGHSFHTVCIVTHARTDGNCPKCGVAVSFHADIPGNSDHALCYDTASHGLTEQLQSEYEHEREERYKKPDRNMKPRRLFNESNEHAD